MIERLLTPMACASRWGRQMRFIAGPRQSGKTTAAKTHLKDQNDIRYYYNWDVLQIKSEHRREIDFIKRDLLSSKGGQKIHWVCFDEIHKMPKWKNILKSYFDAYEDRIRFIVTGSARLDLFRRSGDSLAGRYFLFHLFPLNLFELTRTAKDELKPRSLAEEFIESRLSGAGKGSQRALEDLLTFSGFPEPFLHADSAFLKRWRLENVDRSIREDLRDLTQIRDLETVSKLVALLPERIGNPLSINSLRNILEVSHETVQNYLRSLKLTYVLFELPVYSARISRAIKKEKKVYFFDWTRVEDPGARFENYVAVELLSWTTLWQDAGLGTFELNYIKTRDGRECDFLVVRDKKPWLLLEAKLKDQDIPSHLHTFSANIGGVPMVQLVQEDNALRVGRNKDYRVSASRFFGA